MTVVQLETVGELATLKELATRKGTTRDALYQWLRRQGIPVRKVGSTIVVRESEISRYQARRPNEQ